jgi:hypothetical protein
MMPWRNCCLVMSFLLCLPSPLLAGMAAPLPENPEVVFHWTGTTIDRVQTLSFFLFGLLICAVAVRFLWNTFQRDFSRLSRLSFPKALAGVILWGLLCIIVLTMISGARELFTPGAWKKQGLTYTLTPDGKSGEESAPRRHALERLRTALWHFAATHTGRFPSQGEMTVFASDAWEVPESGGMRFLYVAGRSADESTAILAYEPELVTDQRLVLQTNGAIVTLRSVEIQDRLKERGRP